MSEDKYPCICSRQMEGIVYRDPFTDTVAILISVDLIAICFCLLSVP